MRTSPDVLWRDLDGEAVLLDLARGDYFGLNEVGTRIWRMLDDSVPLDRIVDVPVGEYDADRLTVERDLSVLVGELEARGGSSCAMARRERVCRLPVARWSTGASR